MPSTFLEYLVILCFERRHPKQNTVVRLKSNVLPPSNCLPTQKTESIHLLPIGPTTVFKRPMRLAS